MEQEIVEHQQQQEQPPSIPQKCPRCGSLDTRFRYYNNNSHAQPRHYCKGCQRLWTVGGRLRPIRGRCRNGNPTRASTSGGGNPRFQPTQPWLLGNEHQQNLESPIIQPITNLPAQVSSLDAYHFNDEIPCLDMIQSLIQPEINNSHVNAGDHFISAGANVTVQQEQYGQTLALQQGIMQGTTRNFGSFQTHNEATYRVGQPSWPANLTSQDVADILNFTTENTLLWNNYSCDASDTEDTTSVNVDDWLNFSDDDP